MTSKKRFDFPVPQELRRHKIVGIAIDDDNWVIEYFGINKRECVKSHITGDVDDDTRSLHTLLESRMSFNFSNSAFEEIAEPLIDTIRQLHRDGAAYAIERIKKLHRIEAAKLDGQEKEEEKQEEWKPVFVVKKYSGATTVTPNDALAEAVIINGKPSFAVTINGGNSVTFFDELETADMKLRPPTKQEYPPNSAIEFTSEDELMERIRYALDEDTLYKLYHDVKKYYTKEYFVDTEPHNTVILTTYTITGYFQDKFSTVCYIWLIGDNGSGKNSILITYSWLGYRVFYVEGAKAHHILEYLGTVQEGQGTIAEDELNNLDKDPDKRGVYMGGYASGGCWPKILDASTTGRKMLYWLTYCQKMSASENLPSMKYCKGVLDREFIIKCVKGFSKYNVKETKKHTKTPLVEGLIHDMQALRKRLFAFRLVHHDDVIDEIKGMNISGRALELTEPALLLFHKYKSTEEDNQIFNNEILPTLSSFLSDRVSRRNESLEGKLYPIMRMMVDAQKSEEFDNDTIFDFVRIQMDGRDISDKSDMFYVDDLNMAVTRSKIWKVLREKFKAKQARLILKDGSTKNGHKISMEALDRIKSSYEDVYNINILPEDTSDQQYQQYQVLDQYVGENDAEKEESDRSQETTITDNLHENVGNDVKNGQNETIEGHGNSAPISTEPGLPGFAGKSYVLEETTQCIDKAMLYYNGTDKSDTRNKLQEESYTPETTPDELIALVEEYVWELAQDYDEGIEAVKYEDLYRRCLFSGKFDPLTAANAIYYYTQKQKQQQEQERQEKLPIS
jgi:hypothetical protein